MGSDINTPYRESTPMLTHDTKKLYFTSDRPDGFGGKDIYYSERLDALYTRWSTPKALNPPVNSLGDDSHPHLLKTIIRCISVRVEKDQVIYLRHHFCEQR
jgi:hypothetical protein